MTIKRADPCRAEPLKFTREENRIFAGLVAQKIIAERNCCRELYFCICLFSSAEQITICFRDEPNHSQSNITRLFRTFTKAYPRAVDSIYDPRVGTPSKETCS